MPPPVRRKIPVLALLVGAALAFVSVAYAGNGGFAPEPPVSPNAERIHNSYLWISIFTLSIFILVEGALIAFIIKYKRGRRARTSEGPQVHGATRLELIWTAIPVLILAAIAAFIFYELPGIKDVPKARAQGGPLAIRIDARQFYWQFTYPDGTISISEFHAPVDRVVRLDIFSHDVVHSWWVPQLGGKFDAIPGQENNTWFQADKVGTYLGKCGEFCGVFHAEMPARVVVDAPSEYESWLSAQDETALGRGEWEGACAKCHGITGKGGYGPAIDNSSVLLSPVALRQLLVNGRNQTPPVQNYMPPVGRGWNEKQFVALEAYVKEHIYKGAPSGG
jgi:cytochrome c oxidase subunit II